MANGTKEKIYYPTNDYLFKRIFGHKGNEKITQGLIETLLEQKYEVIEVSSDEVTERGLHDDKLGILDVYVKAVDGTQINVEMQVAEYPCIIDRILFYWAKKYVESIRSGNGYNTLKPTKVILIANFELSKLESLHETINTFKIIDTKSGKLVLTDNLEIVIIELPKMQKYKMENKQAENWLKFIQNPYELGAKDMVENKELEEAKEEYDKIMADEHERKLIEQREKYWLDYNTLQNVITQSKEEYQRIQSDYQKALKEKQIAIKEKQIAVEGKKKAVEGRKKRTS